MSSMRSSPLEVPTGPNSTNSALSLGQSSHNWGSFPRRENDCVLIAATQRPAAAVFAALPLTSPWGASLWLAMATALLSKLVVRRLQWGPLRLLHSDYYDLQEAQSLKQIVWGLVNPHESPVWSRTAGITDCETGTPRAQRSKSCW